MQQQNLSWNPMRKKQIELLYYKPDSANGRNKKSTKKSNTSDYCKKNIFRRPTGKIRRNSSQWCILCMITTMKRIKKIRSCRNQKRSHENQENPYSKASQKCTHKAQTRHGYDCSKLCSDRAIKEKRNQNEKNLRQFHPTP